MTDSKFIGPLPQPRFFPTMVKCGHNNETVLLKEFILSVFLDHNQKITFEESINKLGKPVLYIQYKMWGKSCRNIQLDEINVPENREEAKKIIEKIRELTNKLKYII